MLASRAAVTATATISATGYHPRRTFLLLRSSRSLSTLAFAGRNHDRTSKSKSGWTNVPVHYNIRGGSSSDSRGSGISSNRRYSSNNDQRQQPQKLCNLPETSHDRITITYLTDVEGDDDYLDRYVQQSRILTWRPTTPRWNKDTTSANSSSHDFPEEFSSCRYFPYDHCIDFKDDTGMAIIGGDCCDKGGKDLYVMRQLLDLKRRYSDRVHFIMGNRDINKMRISQEMGLLNPEDGSDPKELPHHEGVYWLRNANQAAGGDPTDPTLYPPADNAAERLRWMLARTMGSPNAFELRRRELLEEKKDRAVTTKSAPKSMENITVTDEEVVRSYRESCHPSTGEIGNYLTNSHLAYRIGQVLVLHGALPLTQDILKETLEMGESDEFWKNISAFAMPWTEEMNTTANTATNMSSGEAIQSWLEELNHFAKSSLKSWREHYANNTASSDALWALKGGYPQGMPFGQLMQYGMGWTADGKRNPTVVYSSWSIDGLPQHFYPDNHKPEDQLFVKLTRDFFRHADLRLILAGHQPQGDMPTPIRVTDDNGNSCLVLCCDTSYSGDTHWVNPPQTPESEMRSNLGRGSGPGFRGDNAVR